MATAQPSPLSRNALIAGATVVAVVIAIAAAAVLLRPASPTAAPGLVVGAPQQGQSTQGSQATSDAAPQYLAQGQGAASKAVGAPGIAAAPADRASALYPIPIGYCQQTPSVQLSGRVLGVTAISLVTATADSGRTLSVNLQNVAPNSADAMSGLNDRLTNLEKALAGAGATDVARNGVSVYGGQPYNNGQYTATAQVTATIKGTGLSAVGDAISKLPGVTGYSAYAPAPAPTSEQVGRAIASATSTAAAMARSAAEAAGVSLGAVQQVSAEPPIACGWNPGGPQQVVQVTMTYALK